jgi:hypothetical protein
MTARSLARLKGEVDAWAQETRLLLTACRQLIEYFGTAKEIKSWNAAIEAPLAWVSIVAGQYAPRARHRGPLPRWNGGVPFRCSQATATIVSPLVEIVGGPVARFVFTIRKILPKPDQIRYIRPYGHFSISFAEAVTQPLWQAYRHLAPAEWKACFPERAAKSERPRAAPPTRRRTAVRPMKRNPHGRR